MTSRALQLKIKRLNGDISDTTSDLEALIVQSSELRKQKRNTLDAAQRQILDRQITDYQEDIQKAEARLKELEEELDRVQSQGGSASSSETSLSPRPQALLEIVQSEAPDILNAVQQAFAQVLPEISRDLLQPQSLQWYVQTLADKNDRFLLKFVAYLQRDVSEPVRTKLQQWGRGSDQYEAIVQEVERSLEPSQSQPPSISYVWVIIQPSKTDPSHYLVTGYILPNDHAYDRKTGFSRLGDGKESYLWEEIPEVVAGFLQQCCVCDGLQDRIRVEVFAPMSHWDRVMEASWCDADEFGIPCRIDQQCLAVVRASERLHNYGHLRMRWEKKWSQMDGDRVPANGVVDGGQPVGELLYQLDPDQAIALALFNNQVTDKKLMFGALLKTATPIALWMRRDLATAGLGLRYQQEQLEEILRQPVQAWPYQVHEKRRETLRPENQSEDDHVGHHLVLLWDNPNFLPPDIETVIGASKP